MAEVVQERRRDPVREFVDMANKVYREMLRELEEHAKFIYYNCPFQGRLTVSLIDGSVDWIDFDGKRVDHTNIREALELARQLAAIARVRADIFEQAAYLEYNEVKELRKAITIAESIGLEVPREARERLNQLEQQLEELKEKLRQLDEQCKQLQNPFTEG